MIKRLFDIMVSLVLIICLSPLILLVSIMISVKLGRPILFSQNRPGLKGKVFKLFKFRSMSHQRDSNANLLPDEQRITAFGHLLRSLSLDELPGLVNVLKGDMSLVGPRPLLVEYLPLYSTEQGRRHNVRPGITGWAQVNGRNTISWEDKFKFDIYYVENQSFWFDMKILLLTVKKVFMREGIVETGQATMSKFTGTHEAGDRSE